MPEQAAPLIPATLFGGMVAFSATFAPLVFVKSRGKTAARLFRVPRHDVFDLGLSALASAVIMIAVGVIGGPGGRCSCRRSTASGSASLAVTGRQGDGSSC